MPWATGVFTFHLVITTQKSLRATKSMGSQRNDWTDWTAEQNPVSKKKSYGDGLAISSKEGLLGHFHEAVPTFNTFLGQLWPAA